VIEELKLMKLIDKQYLDRLFHGPRLIAAWLRGQGYGINRKQLQCLLGKKRMPQEHSSAVEPSLGSLSSMQ
jgi:hypothetical protein